MQRQRGEKVLVLDTGDALIGGGILGDRTLGEVVVAGMDLMGYDAMALGTNELSLGPDVLAQRMAEARFQVLSANAVVAETGQLVAPAYAMFDMGDYRAAVIGLARVVNPPPPGYELLDPAEAAARCVAELGPQADLIIVLTNLSYRAGMSLAQAVPGIDVIIAAQPDQLPSQLVKAPGTGTYITTAEQPVQRHTGRRVGILEMTLSGNGPPTDATWQSVWMSGEIPDDPSMAELLLTFVR